jgi:hypothetical protein
MGRLRTIGFEQKTTTSSLANATDTTGEGFSTTNNMETVETTTVRSGAASLKFTGDGASTAARTVGVTTAEQNIAFGYYARVYMNVPAFTANTTTVFAIMGQTGYIIEAKLTSAGRLQLFAAGSQIGSDSVTLVLGQWERLELFAKVGIGANDSYELRLNGATVASITGANTNDEVISAARFGLDRTAASSGMIAYFDDFAFNNDQGATQNSWPGEGKIVLLIPTSDAQVGSWTGGVGGITNLFDAVNNLPPIGTSAETNLTQIESADTTGDNATDEYRGNMTTYSSAGITADDSITLCQAFLSHGEDVAAGTKTGSFLVLSNPAQVTADTFTFGDDLGALSQPWPSGWRSAWGAAQVFPFSRVGHGTRFSCP